MEDIRALLIGILGGLIIIGLQKVYRLYDKSSSEQEIIQLEEELDHLGLMNKSGLEMQRSAFQSIFVVLSFIAIAGLMAELTKMLTQDSVFVAQYISAACWMLATMTGINYWKRFYRLKNFEDAKSKMESKLEKLRKKSEELGS